MSPESGPEHVGHDVHAVPGPPQHGPGPGQPHSDAASQRGGRHSHGGGRGHQVRGSCHLNKKENLKMSYLSSPE